MTDRGSRVAVVTGASSGIGRAVTLALVGEGWSVVIASRSRTALLAVAADLPPGAAVLVVPADVGRFEDVEHLFAAASQTFGRVEAVVNAAANVAYGRFDDVPPEVFDRVVTTNLIGTANVARAALKHFAAHGGGRLVLMGSLLGKIAVPYLSAYVVSKWGVHALSRIIRIEAQQTPGVPGQHDLAGQRQYPGLPGGRQLCRTAGPAATTGGAAGKGCPGGPANPAPVETRSIGRSDKPTGRARLPSPANGVRRACHTLDEAGRPVPAADSTRARDCPGTVDRRRAASRAVGPTGPAIRLNTVEAVDAVVVGAGPNGLVAAIALADAGWDVLLVEANETVGGAVRSAEITAPGFTSDLFSAFYPLAAASSVIGDLELDRHGLTWVQAPSVLAHALPEGSAAVLARNPDQTAADLDAVAPGDGAAWLDMFGQWQQIRDPLLDAMFTPLPPVRSAARLLKNLGRRGALDLARLAVLPVRRLAAEHFRGDGARLLLTGNAMHADVPPDAAGSGLLGWLLTMLGQDVGFPVPQGGAGNLALAMQSRLAAAGGQIWTGAKVESIIVGGGRALGVRTADGRSVRARRAVLADVDAPTLYHDLVGDHLLPAGLRRDLGRFHWDNSTLKLNWALSSPPPGMPNRPGPPEPSTWAWTSTVSSTTRPISRCAGCHASRSSSSVR